MAEGKTSTRVAMALMCGLAICCAVMYMTADGADVVLAPAESVYGIGGPTSVDSEDVEKAGTVVTNTPDGRMRLTDYLTNVEKEIAAEEAARKRDVTAVREQMARNFAFNKAARAKLKKFLLAKMAVNAKKAKDDLDTGMRHVQADFAAAAALQNKRNKANIVRSKALRKTIRKNKHAAKAALSKQVVVQQRAMAALASATNERIKQTNEHVAVNAAQIKENAKKAREELEAAVNIFDKKVANAQDEAKAGRDKLEQQLKDQDKSIRAWANNKLKAVVAKTAAQFRRVRAKMAEDRHNADMALKSASSKMTAALDAKSALDDNRFAKTVKDIQAAKDEAEARVQAAEASFKTSIYTLSATVNRQVQKTNARMDALAGNIEKNKVAQAKINANVNAEMKRMTDLGNARYDEHLKKDAELKSLIDANKAATNKRLEGMGAHYKAELGAVQATMKKNRAHATHMLAKKSAELYDTIAKNEKAQMDMNGKLKASQERASLDVQEALDEAKDDFANRLGALHKTVVDNDKKFEGKIHKLTGIVDANAVKSAAGRKQLHDIMDANKQELEAAVSDAIAKGEARMQSAENHLVDLNEKTKTALNMKITTEISKLAKDANSQIEGLRLQSKEARAMMKKELIEAVRAMETDAKNNLDAAVDMASEVFMKTNAKEAELADAAAADRAAVAAQIALEKKSASTKIAAATETMAAALSAQKTVMKKKIAATDKRVDAYAKNMEEEFTAIDGEMKAMTDTLLGKIEASSESIKASTDAANAASAAGFEAVAKTVEDELAAATKAAEDKFGKLYTDMATQRSELDDSLASATITINDEIAKQAALADSRFSKTVKDLTAARTAAAADVKLAREQFATALEGVTDEIKAMDTKMEAGVQKVAAEVISHKAMQHTVNLHVQAEIARVEKLMNDQHSKSDKARGKLRDILDDNKKAAHDEVVALNSLFQTKIAQINAEADSIKESASNDLEEATEIMYENMAEVQRTNIYNNGVTAAAIDDYATDANAHIVAAKEAFTTSLDQLTNVVAANHKKVERNFEVLTGVVRDFKQAGEDDRELIRQQNDALNAKMLKAIDEAIQIGEAKAKAVEVRARESLKGTSTALLVEITHTVEEYADKTFKLINGNQQKIADNYLSLKAYAVSAESKLVKYVGHGKGKNLSSLGDLMINIAALADVEIEKEEGLSPSGELPAIFSSGKVKVDNSVSKINGLIHEYVEQVNGCRERWSMGLGKYLLTKLEQSMSKKGVLQVDKVENKAGNWVYVNGHAVGLSNKLNDFEGLAVRMGTYEATLAKLTASLSGKPKSTKAAEVYVPPPEYDGK
jgi:hypothetical protein